MKTTSRQSIFQRQTFKSILIAIVSLNLLVACGGGTDTPKVVVVTPPPTCTPPSTLVNGACVVPPPTCTLPATLVNGVCVVPPPAVGGVVTSVKIQNLSTVQSNLPITFGQIFAKGDLPSANGVSAQLNDGTPLPIQIDAKATHDDGSLRHAIISANLPQLAASTTETIKLFKNATAIAHGVAATPDALLAAGFNASVNVTLNGASYVASADTLLKSGTYTNWLSGALANEWHVSAPLKTSSGIGHPHLTARFAIRSHAGQTGQLKARVDVTIENNWAYEPGQQNFTYDAQILVGGKAVYSKTALTHYHHARWRKLFWWGDEPQIHVQHDTAYLIASKAVPNYDQSIVFTAASIEPIRTKFTGAVTEPMKNGMAEPYMPTTGGRADIGLMPGWAATYLLTMDKDAKQATLGTADLAGSWSSHYRNKMTDRPISVKDFPYMTMPVNVNDTFNPATGKLEAFPFCAASGSCANPNVEDASHQPGFAYLPYLVTGDYYYLEELQFWAMRNVFANNPGYRENIKGLLYSDQVRGQAWSIRTLSQAAYITPDADPLKSHFDYFLSNNLEWFNTTYSNNASANALGIITNGYAIVYDNGTGVAPWQDDFFTSAVGMAADLDYAKAKTLLAWKAKFPIARMSGASACWIDGAIYAIKIRDTSTSPIYSTIGQAYQASHTSIFNALPCAGTEMAANLGLKVGEMTGYSSETTGFPSNMQPALAYSANSGVIGGSAAWTIFNNRTVKPNYSTGPQFAIIPRN